MAGVVSSDVLESELTFTLTSSEESESLQDLIDSELALRIQEPPPESFSREFLAAERLHSDLCHGGGSPAPPCPAPARSRSPSPSPSPQVLSPVPAASSPTCCDVPRELLSPSRSTDLLDLSAASTPEPETSLRQFDGEKLSPPDSPEVSEHQFPEESDLAPEDGQEEPPGVGAAPGGAPSPPASCCSPRERQSPRDSPDFVSGPRVLEIHYQNSNSFAVEETAFYNEKAETRTTVTTEKKVKKKTKKSKKSDEKENHISVKSSFSKFDQLSKKAVFHVRSSDTAKAQKTFSQGGSASDTQGSATCKSCGNMVFAMEQIKAESAVWHKNCFRCKTCNKQLTVDIYSSDGGEVYCKPHFKELFKPKAVVEEEEPVRRRKPEMIIRENQPVELPPDVVRASDKADLGLEELTSLNVKSRFQVFEKPEAGDGEERSLTPVNVKRSPSILSKLARFQKKGMDIGVTDESLNGFVYEESSSSEENEEDEEEEETGVIKCRKIRERPMSFNKMDDMKKNWESGYTTRKDEMREQRKEEMQHIRSRLFMGKQGKMKELYEQAVAESEGRLSKKDLESDIVRSEKAKVVREKFEKGEAVHSDSEEEKNSKQKLGEDMSVFEEGISKKSRSLFLEMDAHAAKAPPSQPPKPVSREPVKKTREVYISRQPSEDIVKATDSVEDVVVETADLSSKFKFFETYKAPEVKRKSFRITPPRDGQVKTESPEREIYHDPEVVRSEDRLDDDEQIIKRSQTASKMLSIFRQMEGQKEVLPEGPKPKKCFTPPPDYKEDKSSEEEESEEGSEEESEEEEEESDEETNGIIRSSHKVKDEFLEQARNAARAKALAAKFEKWEPEKQSNNNAITMLDSDNPSIDSTKSLCARFESLKTEQPKEKPRPKVHRFVEISQSTKCIFCDKIVYPLEKIETSGKIFHKQCFRCTQCNTVLRMDSYTLNNCQLYCIPHYKQLFITKGNYDEGFGSNQHKRKWETPVNGSS